MKYILFFVVATLTTHVRTTPIQFPDNEGPIRQTTNRRQIESRAYRKPNSNYNRLTLNRITVHDDDNIDDYDDTVVLPDNTPLTTTTAAPTVSTYTSSNNVVNDEYDYDDQNSDVLSDGSRRRRRRPFCIPFQVPTQHNGGGYYRNDNRDDDSKTFGGITYINQHYNLNSGYPNYGDSSDQHQDNNIKPVNEVQSSPSHNQHHAGYGCIPLYYRPHHGINRPHHRPPGSHFQNRPSGGYGGFGNRPWYNGFGGNRPNYNGGGNRPQGGPFGFFGNGGLFDFSNLFGGNGGGGGGGSGDSGDSTSSNIFNRPISSIQNNRPSVTYSPPTSSNNNNNQEIFSDSVSDDNIKPVFEINVPDTIQDVVYNVRPVVGGIASQVSGFIQQLATRPGQTVNRINREFNSFLRPIYNIF